MRYVEWDRVIDVTDVLRQSPIVKDSDDPEEIINLIISLLGLEVKEITNEET